jgi:hypothetical protein
VYRAKRSADGGVLDDFYAYFQWKWLTSESTPVHLAAFQWLESTVGVKCPCGSTSTIWSAGASAGYGLSRGQLSMLQQGRWRKRAYRSAVALFLKLRDYWLARIVRSVDGRRC